MSDCLRGPDRKRQARELHERERDLEARYLAAHYCTHDTDPRGLIIDAFGKQCRTCGATT